MSLSRLKFKHEGLMNGMYIDVTLLEDFGPFKAASKFHKVVVLLEHQILRFYDRPGTNDFVLLKFEIMYTLTGQILEYNI